jgi:hypothetical protein
MFKSLWGWRSVTQRTVRPELITTEVPVPGCATGANRTVDIEMAVRFVVEVGKAFGEGKCSFYDEKEFHRLISLYGSLEHLKTPGNR